VPADGSVVPADESLVLADGSVVPTDGLVVPAKGSLVVELADKSVVPEVGSVVPVDGSVVTAEESVELPEGEVIVDKVDFLDESSAHRSEIVVIEEADVIPDRSVVAVDGPEAEESVELPEGELIVDKVDFLDESSAHCSEVVVIEEVEVIPD